MPLRLAPVRRALRDVATLLAMAVRAYFVPASARVPLEGVRRRLELYLAALYDRPIAVTVAEPPKSRGGRRAYLAGGATWRRRPQTVLGGNDGQRIHLPGAIAASAPDEALTRYRLIATQQAERLVRGTAAWLPEREAALVRDLFLLREGVSVEAAVGRRAPGLRASLAAARSAALRNRPSLGRLTPSEREVELLLRAALGPAARDGTPAVTPAASPEESLAWARETAARIGRSAGRYRGVWPIADWGAVRRPPSPAVAEAPVRRADMLPTLRGSKYGIGKIGRGAQAGGNQESSDGTERGATERPRPDSTASEKTPEAPPGVGPRGDGDGSRETSDRVPHAGRAAPPHDRDGEGEAGGATARGGPLRRTRPGLAETRGAGSTSVEYPEWDWEAGDYRARGAIVRHHQPSISDESWARRELARYGPVVRRIRERFDRLRARRVKLMHQRDGDELDLDACVGAFVDRHTGRALDERIYVDVRPARRGLAIVLLVDISGSTDDWIDTRRRVIDVEKLALLIASEALDALGDLYGIVTFSGKGRENVRVRTVKDFAEPNGRRVRERIAALEPEGYTRTGAAVRHATALLERQPAGHRLLLLLSDGKPNDVDDYEGRPAVEDTRQAIAEARQRGIYPFCLTIDRQGQEYLGRIFGAAGHTILRVPEQLPLALARVVRTLLSS